MKTRYASSIGKRCAAAVIGLGVPAALLGGYGVVHGQGEGNPFIFQSETVTRVHVLPSAALLHRSRDAQQTFATPETGATVFPSNRGGGNLIYRGGAVMQNPAFYAIYWNSEVANSPQTSMGYPTIEREIANFITTFMSGGSYKSKSTAPQNDYAIVGQYSDSSRRDPVPASSPPLRGSLIDDNPAQLSIQDSDIQVYLASLFAVGEVPVSANIVYGVYFPSGMQVQLGGLTSCAQFCGYHSYFTYKGTSIKYAVFPYPDCGACNVGLPVADMLTIVASHEIREAVTDPEWSGAAGWVDAIGQEADDKCAWQNLYQLKRAAANLKFWVQPEFSNGGRAYPGPGCVVP